MASLNFSAHGMRWRVTIVTADMAAKPQIPRLPGTGLLFTSDDASMRFLAFTSEALPSEAELREKSTQELGLLVQRAAPLAA